MSDKLAIGLILFGSAVLVAVVAIVADHPVIYRSVLSWFGM